MIAEELGRTDRLAVSRIPHQTLAFTFSEQRELPPAR